MSMIMGLVTLGDANIARVLKDPPLVWRVIAPDEPDMYEDVRAEHPAPRGASPEEFELSNGEGVAVDLDKAWHGVHYLLTGTEVGEDPPLNFIYGGGADVGDLDVGYGPARVLTSSETRAAFAALSALSDEELEGRFDAQDMLDKRIYPTSWEDDPESLGYLMENVRALRGLLKQATDARVGLVLYLS